MNDLFIFLYLDEDVDVLVAQLIRARGFEVTTTRMKTNCTTMMSFNWNTLFLGE